MKKWVRTRFVFPFLLLVTGKVRAQDTPLNDPLIWRTCFPQKNHFDKDGRLMRNVIEDGKTTTYRTAGSTGAWGEGPDTTSLRTVRGKSYLRISWAYGNQGEFARYVDYYNLIDFGKAAVREEGAGGDGATDGGIGGDFSSRK
jgi:hypothetical protein